MGASLVYLENPNKDIATTAKLIPSLSSAIPKLYLMDPELISTPTVPIRMPITVIDKAFRTLPLLRTTEDMSANNIKQKYSAGPNLKAIDANGGANAAIIAVDTVPAKKLANAAVASATPARPCRAI